jgi:hypothetical protein
VRGGPPERQTRTKGADVKSVTLPRTLISAVAAFAVALAVLNADRAVHFGTASGEPPYVGQQVRLDLENFDRDLVWTVERVFPGDGPRQLTFVRCGEISAAVFAEDLRPAR